MTKQEKTAHPGQTLLLLEKLNELNLEDGQPV